MVVKVFGIITDINEVQFSNALFAISRVPTLTLHTPVKSLSANIKQSFKYKTLLPAFNAFSNSPVPENALLPILITLFGIIIDFKERHFEKANSPILITPSGISTKFKVVQLENT